MTARHHSFALLLLGLLAFACKSTAPVSVPPPGTTDSSATVRTTDSVLCSFVVLGCNRLDKADAAASGDPSTANLVQLDRTFADVMKLSPRPDLLFLAGDLILGKVNDAPTLDAQLSGWRAHYEASPIAASGIRLVVIPGNHETNDGDPSGVGESEWVKVMAPYIPFSNGPSVGGPDGSLTDQSHLTGSFDLGPVHFILLNTDAASQSGQVPVRWLAGDLASTAAARASHTFVLAHRPAYAWNGKLSEGIAQPYRDSLWQLLSSHKVEAMFAAHNHIYRRLQPTSTTWMVIAGNGGSSLASPTGADRNFGFTRVLIHKSGAVELIAYGREYGAKYTDPSPESLYPTTVRDTASLTRTW